MADLADVETALTALVAGVCYPNGTAQPSVTGSEIRLMRGFPVAIEVGISRAAGVAWVYIGSVPHGVRPAPLGLTEWRDLSAVAVTLAARTSGRQVTFSGLPSAGQIAGILCGGVPYAYAVRAGDTTTTIAAALAALIPGATSAASTVTCPATASGRVVGSRTAYRELRAQEQAFTVTVLATTPGVRDTIAGAIDAALAGMNWLALSDHQARLTYRGTEVHDEAATNRLYRRTIDYAVAYSTTEILTAAAMLFGSVEVYANAAAVPDAFVKPPVGAIRFDAWYDPSNGINQQTAAALSPSAWNSRLPGNATVTNGAASWPLATQATMDAEITAAKAAGLGFWAFDSYPPGDTLSLALQLYLSSSIRSGLDFCMIGQSTNWADTTTSTGYSAGFDRDINLMSQPGYLTVLGNRPLLFVLDGSAQQLAALPAGGVAAAINVIRSRARAAGLGNPYVVWLSGAAVADYDNTPAAVSVGADAVGSYCTPRLTGTEQTYAALAGAAAADWDNRAGLGMPIVPTGMCGWDQRPLIETPQPFYPIGSYLSMSNFYDTGTAPAIAAHIGALASWVQANPAACPAGVGLVYAWNELAEGGWLMPTYTPSGPDSSRCAALGAEFAALEAGAPPSAVLWRSDESVTIA